MLRFYLKRNDLDLVDLPIDDDAVDDADRRCRCRRRQNVFQRRRHHLRFRFRLSAGRALLQKPEHFNAESFFRTSLPFPALFFQNFPPKLIFLQFFKLNRTQKMEHCSPGNGASSQRSHFPLCCNGIPISTWKIKGNNFFQECLFFRIMGLSSNFFFSWHDFAKKLGSTKTILRRLSRTRPVWGKFQGYGATMGKLHHHV